MRICSDCKHFNVKSSIGPDPKDERGGCLNTDFHAEVHIGGITFLDSTLRHMGKPDREIDEIKAILDVRVKGNFGCRHWSKKERESPPIGFRGKSRRCPVCYLLVTVNRDGTLRSHPYTGPTCEGSGTK